MVLQFAGVAKPHGAQEAQIAGGKSVRLPERSHSHVLRRPLPNARNLTQPIQQSFEIHHTLETDSSITHGPSESPDSLGSSSGETDPGKFRVGQHSRCGKKMGEAIACGERLPKVVH